VANSNADAIARCVMKRNANQNVANIAEVIVESNDDGTHPAEAWDTANVFDGKWIVSVVHILCIGRDC
jgi:hypothetical protein